LNNGVKFSGLWKHDKDGKKFLRGRLNLYTDIVILPNDFKKSEKEPDYIMYFVQKESNKENESKKEDNPDEL